jgi:hypothetical protein
MRTRQEQDGGRLSNTHHQEAAASACNTCLTSPCMGMHAGQCASAEAEPVACGMHEPRVSSKCTRHALLTYACMRVMYSRTACSDKTTSSRTSRLHS